jgi:beta-galactosidase
LFLARKKEDLPYYMDWCEFKEELLHRPLDRMLDMLLDRGFDGLLTYHNYPLNLLHSPFNVSRGEKTFHFVGVDYYNKKTDHEISRKRFLTLSGTSRFPVSPEFSSGCYQVWTPIELADQRYMTYLAIACGLKGFNFYMLVERERWYGSPIKRNGELRKNYADFYKQLLLFIRESGVLEMDRQAEVLLLRSRDYDRLEKAADLLSPLPYIPLEGKMGAAERCSEDHFGFEQAIQIDHDEQYNAWYNGLTRGQVPFACADTDVDPEFWKRYKAIVLPTFEFLGKKTQNLLHDYVEAGGTIILGPDTPSRDELMREYSTLDLYTSRPVHKLDCTPDTFVFNAGAGRLVLVNGLFGQDPAQTSQMIDQVCKATHIERPFPSTPPCETSIFHGEDGRTIVFVINPTDKRQRPRITTGGGVYLQDLLTTEEFHGGDFALVDMDPYSVRPLEVLHV